MTTMLEKAARALHAHWRENFDHGVCQPDQRLWDDLSPEDRAYGIGQARAVLMAVRQPDEMVCFVGDQLVGDHGSNGEGVFTAMIDHILSEGEG